MQGPADYVTSPAYNHLILHHPLPPGTSPAIGKGKSLSRVQLFATPRTAAYQAPPSMGFSRQEYWSGVPSPSPAIRQFQCLERMREHCMRNTGGCITSPLQPLGFPLSPPCLIPNKKIWRLLSPSKFPISHLRKTKIQRGQISQLPFKEFK